MAAPCREFCARNGIEREVMQTLDLAKRHFSRFGEPSFVLVDDPETHASYLAIHVDVTGDSEVVFRRSESFFDDFVTSIDRNKQRLISLVYHAI
jgi:hypothetical protein